MTGIEPKRTTRRSTTYAFLGFALFLVLSSLMYAWAFGPVWKVADTEEFIVSPKESVAQVASDLTAKGFIRAPWIFEVAYLHTTHGSGIRPGGYHIRKSMDAWTIASQLVAVPYLGWVTIPPGVRKEQIGQILADSLGWTEKEIAEWNAVGTSSEEYAEGVYLPGTYLVLTDEAPAVVAQKMREQFFQAFAPYAGEAAKEKLAWPDVLTIASLIEREAGSKSDMPIIAGIIQRRLSSGMPLAIDATLQYIQGNEEEGWWPTPSPAATYPDSPFNTYKRKGLPPHPISNASLAAIDAAIHPTETNCLFYIHDTKGRIHCSPTYAGHLANIRTYLR
jgi:UPF0755 protein